jgi:hypothetical protein
VLLRNKFSKLDELSLGKEEIYLSKVIIYDV